MVGHTQPALGLMQVKPAQRQNKRFFSVNMVLKLNFIPLRLIYFFTATLEIV